MFGAIDRLNIEIVNVQVLDNYLKNGEIRFDTFFMRTDYKEEMKRLEGLLKHYENNEVLGTINDEEEVDEELPTYTYDEVLELLVADLDIYALMYDVPKIKIENAEWDLLFTTISKYYQEHEFAYSFMDDMVTFNKMTIARSMVYEEESIDLETYITSLKYIESDILSINNIIEIAERLGEVFKIDALSLLANEDGSYGCIGKDSQVFIVDSEDEDAEELGIEALKQHLESQGYKVNATVKVEVEEKLKEGKVIDFKTHRAKTRK